jgi:hypothetical protein
MPFTIRQTGGILWRLMKSVSGIFLVACLLLLGVGCTHSHITNLTPANLPRNANGFYPVEMIWENNTHTLRHESVKPMVMVGTQVYPMKRTPLVTNRWETLVPVPAEASELRYRIKVNWEYNAVPVPDANSQRSEEFLLRISDN